ncbi:MAG TPA: flagellar hook-length control protein FliK [Steroidobacteraceae bacterium]|nr:flagellar hook-length control protein FliK [Steroidobacteraceae bacterium]
MGTPSPLRVGAAPAQSRTTSTESAPAENRDFLSLLGAPAAASGVETETPPERSTQDESTSDWLTDGLAQLLPGLFPPQAAASDGEAPGHSGTADALLVAGEGEVLPDAVTQSLEADALSEALLGQITAGKAVGEGGTADVAQDLLRQFDTLLPGAKAEAAPGLRLPAAELPGLMVQASAGSSAVTVAPATSGNSLEQALRSSVGSPRWADELGTRLVVMSARGQQEGSLTLSPEHLGPLEVRISIHHNTANVWFGAQHADTRAALTEAMPRLRELFGDAGLSLGHAGVSEEAPRHSAATGAAGAGFDDAGETAPVQTAPVTVRQLSNALLDLYA